MSEIVAYGTAAVIERLPGYLALGDAAIWLTPAIRAGGHGCFHRIARVLQAGRVPHAKLLVTAAIGGKPRWTGKRPPTGISNRGAVLFEPGPRSSAG